VNTVFYVVAGFVVLAAFGLDINSIFILLSSILVSFAFMIGSASSKYLEVSSHQFICTDGCLGEELFSSSPKLPICREFSSYWFESHTILATGWCSWIQMQL
jgi:hypothetical protein